MDVAVPSFMVKTEVTWPSFRVKMDAALPSFRVKMDAAWSSGTLVSYRSSNGVTTQTTATSRRTAMNCSIKSHEEERSSGAQ